MKKGLHIIFLLLLSYAYSQASWQNLDNILTNGNNQRFDDVFFINEQMGWVANGAYATVYKTEDGGVSWIEQLNEAQLGGNYYFRNIEFLNENIGFLGTLNGKFFRTTDGGSNWTEITNITPNPSAICGLDAVGTSTIYGCGAYSTPAHIIKSTDNGQTWQFIDMSSYANALVEIYFLTEDIGFTSGRNDNGACILKTLDGGNSWQEIYNSSVPGEYLWKMQVLESNNNIIFGSVQAVTPNLGKLVKSTDGGQNWASYNAPETAIQAVGFISENKGWMGGHTTGFYETLDGGQTWNSLNIGNNLNRIFIIRDNLAYCSGSSIYKFTEETLNTKHILDQPRTPLTAYLKKNPSSDWIEIVIEFSSDDTILIELYDAHGKYLKHLSLDHINQQTEKHYQFAIDELSSGIYFIDLHNNTGRQSLKFIKK